MYPVGGISLREREGVRHYLFLSLPISSSTAHPTGNTRHRANIYIRVSFIWIPSQSTKVIGFPFYLLQRIQAHLVEFINNPNI